MDFNVSKEGLVQNKGIEFCSLFGDLNRESHYTRDAQNTRSYRSFDCQE